MLRKFSLLVAALLVVTGITFWPASADIGPDGSVHSITPVLDAPFADPDFLVVGSTYHAYATNYGGDNVQHRTSTDGVTWTKQADVLPVLGSWVGPCSFSPGGDSDHCVWAPEVTAVQGGYALYYTARDEASGKQCIGLATSTSPDGPFVDTRSSALICPTDQGGAIDAGTYAENGQLHLVWKSDGNCCNLPAIIYLQTVSPDGTTLTSAPKELIRNTQPWEGAVVEGPTLIKRGDLYYLFYSANDFYGGNYNTGYATSTAVDGPYVKATTPLMTSELFSRDVQGPGGQDVIQAADGTWSIYFHGWDEFFRYRALYRTPITFDAAGKPAIAALSTRYEAENAVVTHANVVNDNGASAGKKVGGMDFADSAITWTVTAAAAGEQTIGLRYTNGSWDGPRRVQSTDRLTVNGVDLGPITLDHTTWGNWQTLEKRVPLVAGSNTITVTRVSYFAEIDYLDVYPTTPDPVLPSVPTLPGDTTPGATRYEAENGVVTHAVIGNNGNASGGKKVGAMDFDDSSVAVDVTVPAAGAATLYIRYHNGSERGGYSLPASHVVGVNGVAQTTVFYPHTRWENWHTIAVPVTLESGVNTVKLTRRSFYAEIDYIDVKLNPAITAPATIEAGQSFDAAIVGFAPGESIEVTFNGATQTVTATPDGTATVTLSVPAGAALGDYPVTAVGVSSGIKAAASVNVVRPTATVTVTASPTSTPTATVTASPTANPTVTVPTSPTAQPTAPAGDLYSTPGFHRVNNRLWFTQCEPYSQTVRCRTDIWSTQVHLVRGSYVRITGWHFNNLTYLPLMTRAQWGTNPLANTGAWTQSGRQWKTECDTAVTGRNGCRSWIMTTYVTTGTNADGSPRYSTTTGWVFNNIVRFKV